jgi:hypothetical protein
MAAAAYYSDRLSDRTRRGKRLKALAGEVDARRSFGFEPDGVTLRPDEADVIREHARRLLAGESQEALIAELNSGVPTVRGAAWGYTTYRQIMTRPRNAGLIAHNGAVLDGVRLPEPHILDEATHNRLVALYASRKPGRPPSGKYVCTGMAVCGPCGANLAGRPVTGTPRRQYWCKRCRHTFVDAARLDDWAGDWAIRTLSDPAHADAVARAERETQAERARLMGEVASAESLATAMAERLGRGEITLARYDAVTAPLDARLGQLRTELEALKAEPAPLPADVRTIPLRDQTWLGWLEQWTEGTTAEQRTMLARALAGRKLVVGRGKAARFDASRVSVP